MDEPIIEGNGDPTTGRVPFSLVLFKAQEFVGIVNVRVAQIFDIAETHTCIETKDEGIANVLLRGAFFFRVLSKVLLATHGFDMAQAKLR